MRTIDFSPLYRSVVGFDRLADLLETATAETSANGYPPYNIERTDENAKEKSELLYRGIASRAFERVFQLADHVQVKGAKLENGLLHIDLERVIPEEKKPETSEAGQKFLHRGIAARSFERRFQLADYVEVKGADLKDGLLHVDLVRNIPERMKPRTVAIGTSGEAPRIDTAA